MLKFSHPTLITLTAPTCAGKSHLLNTVTSLGLCQRIVSTTTRKPRPGEINGVDYYFISAAESQEMEAAGKFAELVTFNGTRYGVTHDEMESKMMGGAAPIVIVEPTGVEQYEHYCHSKNWHVFSVFVSTPEATRFKRFMDRTFLSVKGLYDNHSNAAEFDAAMRQIIQTHTERLKVMMQEERSWISKHSWDVIVSGESDTAVDDLISAVINRNSRSDVYT